MQSNIFNQHNVLVSWSVKSCGGSREDKMLTQEVLAKADAKVGSSLRCVRDHLPPILRKQVSAYSNGGRQILSQYGIAWGNSTFLIPLDRYIAEVKPKLVALQQAYHDEVEKWAENWAKVRALSSHLLGKSYDPDVLPLAEQPERVKASFRAVLDVQQLPPATVMAEGLSEEARAEIAADVEATLLRKFGDIVDTLVDEAHDLAKKLLALGEKVVSSNDNGHTRRSLQCTKEHLATIAQKVKVMQGGVPSEALNRLLSLISRMETATAGEWKQDELASIMAEF
jgi:hypothetical protein